jgi:hypothetical protein
MDGWMDESISLLFFSSILHHPFLYYLLYTTTVWEFSFQVFLFCSFSFSFPFFFLPWFYAMTYKRKILVYSEDTFSCTILCLQRARTFRLTSCTMISKCLYFSSFEKEIVKPFVMPLSLFFYNDASFYAKENFCCSLYSR